ncbi:hypothetical protein NBRC116493_16130 [Aurantivibrio infirmus]
MEILVKGLNKATNVALVAKSATNAGHRSTMFRSPVVAALLFFGGNMKNVLILIALVLSVSIFEAKADVVKSPIEVFESIKSLTGEWQSLSEKSKTKITFEVIANGSAISERWSMGSDRTSLTIYSMDGDTLIATHYCPQGNAPTLAYNSVGENGYRFIFKSETNMQNTEGYHEHEFSLLILSNNSIKRGEIYVQNGKSYDPKENSPGYEEFKKE